MGAGGDAAAPGPHNALSTMSAADAWGLNPGELHAKFTHREAILAELKRKLEDTEKSPVAFLEAKYSSAEDKEQYARRLWQELPPVEANPPMLSAAGSSLFGNTVGSLAEMMCVSCTWPRSPSRVSPWCASQLLTRS